jgi:trimeric autotransporter adhesin
MKKSFIFHGCTAALIFCAGQVLAQQSAFTKQFSLHSKTFNSPPGHTGVQAYDPPRKWHGLDLALFFGTDNTVTGYQALYSCTSCGYNVADGYTSLQQCTTCSSNVAIGFQALIDLTTGIANTAIGSNALEYASTYSNNTAVGSSSMNVSFGSSNTALGVYALAGSSASYNTAVGGYAFFNCAESYGTAIGYYALFNSQASTGYNTAVGAYALMGSTSEGNEGFYNVAIGANAIKNNQTGNDNVALGYEALMSDSTGSFNNASGLVSLYSNTTGSANVADGLGALVSNTTGSENTGIGMEALNNNTTGTYNTALGFGANTSSGTLTNATALGATASVTASNQVVIGNSSVTSIGGYAAWTKFSDGRFKKNIQENVPGLAFINKLNPVTYTLDVSGIESKLHQSDHPALDKIAAGARSSAQDDQVMNQAMREKAAIIYTGFVAQDVEKAAESVNYVFSGVDKPKDASQSFYGLRYEDFVPPLVKAVQELSAKNDSLQDKYDSLQTQVNELRAMVLALKSTAAAGASLDQNVPNPFTGSTVIGFSLPKGVASAQMQITDATGKLLATIPLSGSGKNTLTANVSGFASGTYNYSLIINGRLISTKQMISVR